MLGSASTNFSRFTSSASGFPSLYACVCATPCPLPTSAQSATRLFWGKVLRQHLDLGRQRALVEQEAFKALDVLIALGDLLPLLFQL